MGTASVLEEAVERGTELLSRARYVVALVGAGMSVESGIPPFRGPGGLWTRFGEPPMNGYQIFLQDPKAWWESSLKGTAAFSGEFREAIEKARPNPGHYALAELEGIGLLRYIITQNVDNLHQEAGSRNVAEIHGNRHKLRCVACEARFPRQGFPIDPNNLPPRCPECGGVVKGDGVMFGEPIPSRVLSTCQEQAMRCDCMLLLGTSGTVYPAAGFSSVARRGGGSLIEINPYDTSLTPICQVVVRANTGEALPMLVQRVKALHKERL